MSSGVFVAPVGTTPEGEWTEVGHMESPHLLIEDSDPVETFEAVRSWSDGEVSLRFLAGPHDIFAQDVKVRAPATRWVQYQYEVPALPTEPRKRRRLTGKAYRIARRRFRRQVQAWERAGRPTITKRLGFHAEVVDAVPSRDGSELAMTMRLVPPPGSAYDSPWFQRVPHGTPAAPGMVAWTP